MTVTVHPDRRTIAQSLNAVLVHAADTLSSHGVGLAHELPIAAGATTSLDSRQMTTLDRTIGPIQNSIIFPHRHLWCHVIPPAIRKLAKAIRDDNKGRGDSSHSRMTCSGRPPRCSLRPATTSCRA